ncbi:MAG: spore coat protein CotJB [Clostridiales bacterium]
MAANGVMGEAQMEMIHRLQELGLTMDDLRQYLDTHLYDQFAIARFNTTRKEYHDLMAAYGQQYGPINGISMNKDENSWLWATQAFPWEY